MSKAYKGFDKDLKCRGFQYEIDKEYEEEKAVACQYGFHACEYPLDVFNYYPPVGNRFCEVEQSGYLSKHSDGSKVASTKIKIGAELSIAGMVKAAIEYTKERTHPEGETATGYQGAASATGTRGAASATGTRGAASATGYQGAASATGSDSVAIATGKGGKAMASIGSAIFLVERSDWNGRTYPIVCVKTAIVDGENIKANTWYTLINGEFVEVEVES